MINPNMKPSFAEQLIGNDTDITPDRIAEYRCKLNARLRRYRSRERRMRLAILVMVATAAVGILGLLLASAYGPNTYPVKTLFELLPEPVVLALAVILLGSGLCLVPFLLLHKFEHRRRLQNAEREEMLTILADLQRQLSDLQARIGESGRQP